MAKWQINSETLVDIANAVRAKRGTSASIQVSDLADEIALINDDGLLRDRLIIPDKYNTGCHGQLKKFDPTTDTSGIGWRDDGNDILGIDFNKPASTRNLTDNQIIIFQDYDFTTYKSFYFMNMSNYTTDKSYYRDNLTFVFINCLFIVASQQGAIPQDTKINFIFCNCTANKIGISGFIDRCLLGNVTFFQSIREGYVPEGDPLNPSSPFVIKNSYIMDVEAHTAESGTGHMDGLQISTRGGHDQLVYNCRFECFDMPYDHSQGGWSYSMFWEGLVTDSAIEYCIFHGGGYYGTSLKKADNQNLHDNLISGEYHMDADGSESQWNRACYPNENNWQMSDGWADYISTLLVSSVWVEDNKIKICYSNDMHSTRTMRIVDNNGRVTTVSVPACPIRVTAETEGITQWSDLPFDRVAEINATGVDSINIYDGDTLVRTFIVNTAGSISNMAEKNITQNGTYTASAEDLDGYSSVTVNVPTGASGTIEITENGTSIDVERYQYADVAVPQPSGTTTIRQNGTYDIAQFASATVDVDTSTLPRYIDIKKFVMQEDSNTLNFTYDTHKTLVGLYCIAGDIKDITQNYSMLSVVYYFYQKTNGFYKFGAVNGYNGSEGAHINNGNVTVDSTTGAVTVGVHDNRYYYRAGHTYYVIVLYEDSAPIYNITRNITGGAYSLSQDNTVSGGDAYTTTIGVPDAHFTLGTVTITMGGTDITSTAYNTTTHAVSIADVTGDIVITATATNDYFAAVCDYTGGGQYDESYPAEFGVYEANTARLQTSSANSGLYAYLPIHGSITQGFTLYAKAHYVQASVNTGWVMKAYFVDAQGTQLGSAIDFITDSTDITTLTQGISGTVDAASAGATALKLEFRTGSTTPAEAVNAIMQNLRFQLSND